MNFINALYTFVTNPSEAMDGIIKSRSMPLALLGYLVGSLSVMIVLALDSGGIGNLAFTFGFFGVLFVDFCLGFFVASSAHLLLEMATDKGSAVGLFTLIGLSQFALTFLVSFALIEEALPFFSWFRFLAFLGVAVLQLWFILYMMNKAYGLSKIGTLVTLLLSVIPAFLSLFVAGGAIIFFLVYLIV